MDINSNNLSKPAADMDSSDTDILAILLILLRGWKIVLFFALLGLVIGVLYSRYENPTFKSDALIQIDEKSQGISALGANISNLVSTDASPAQTEARLITSRMVLKPVVDLLHLGVRINDPKVDAIDRIANNRTATQVNTVEGIALGTIDGNVQISRFDVTQGYHNKSFTLTKNNDGGFSLTNGFDNFKGQLNQPHKFKGADGTIEITVIDLPDDNHPITIRKQSLQDTTDAIKGALTVTELDGKTGIIELSMIGPNQQQITSVLEQVILSYVAQNKTRGSEENTKTLDFMETQIPLLKQKLEASEAIFNDFREKSGSIDINQEAGLLVNKTSEIDSQISELNLKKAELVTYYTEEHPLVVQINDQLRLLKDRNQQVETRIENLPEIQREFLKLSEDTAINRDLYLTMLKNYEQLKIVKAGEIGYARIVDMPISTYRTIAPKKQLIIMLATLSGLVLGLLLVFLRSLLRNTVKDPDRLEIKTGVPVIATVPRSPLLTRLGKNKNASNRLLSYVDHNSMSYEAIKSLRTHLMFGMPDTGKSGHRAKIILISGESIGVGKSFISANLTEVFSQLNKKVLIIDADMRMGELHNIFSVEHKSGLADYLSQGFGLSQHDESLHTDQPLTDFIHPTAMNHIDFMPRGQQPHNPTSLLASDKFGQLMSELNAHYDYIVIDSPPILAASDAVILSQYTDKLLMVARYNKSVERQVVYAVKLFNKAQVQVDGIVLNDVQKNLLNKYSYNYNYAYGDNK